MNKKIIWAVLLIVILAVIFWYKGKTPVTPTQTIKIGVVAPITGGGTLFGTGLVKGIELAKKDLGGSTYELIIEDDASKPAQSASAAQKLINIDKVQALISVTSGTGNAVKPIAAAAKIPHIAVASDIRISDGLYNFTNLALPDDEANAWLAEAKARGIKTVAILAQNQPGLNLLIDNVKAGASAAGIKIVYETHFDPTTQDFKTEIAKAVASKPDNFLVSAFPPSLDIIGQQLRDAKITNVSGIATFSLSASPHLFDGEWYTDPAISDQAFKDRFVKETGIRFNARTAPYGYDSFNMLVAAFERGGSVSDYILNTTEYNGKAGKLTKAKGEASFRSQAGIWMVKDGEDFFVK
ncbi:MAG: Branched-chain amino acid transport system substrate-binding protein [Parcubacteria group bacterium]|nr:Branched-chain amino acid transport system substrate-binding protein [Parcubacteria group bacterium]